MLNAKQEKFINNIVDGMSQRQAYKDAYNAEYDDDAIDNKASKLFNKDEVQARYKELIEQLKDKTIMSAKERMKWLTDVINGDIKEVATTFHTDEEGNTETIESEFVSKLDTRLKALDTLNKMSGEYVTKLEGNVKIEKLEDLL